jgi:hypothetical protein
VIAVDKRVQIGLLVNIGLLWLTVAVLAGLDLMGLALSPILAVIGVVA